MVNYMDVDPASGSIADFTCAARSYDEHDGTDFAIRDWKTMKEGVDVLAAAEGRVLRLRDGVADQQLSDAERRKVLKQDRGCGNGVLIEHGAGWQTMYCHLKQDSIVVAKGETVKAGQKIGEVGQSGNAEFPHVHLEVVHEGQSIDPYTGQGAQEGCGGMKQSLWADDTAPVYEPVTIYAAGFKDSVPDFELIKQDAGTPEELSADIPALTFWVALYGVTKGDQIHLEILDPQGAVFAEQAIVQEKTRARQFYYTGKKAKGLATGNYTGTVKIMRKSSDGKTVTRELVRKLAVK